MTDSFAAEAQRLADMPPHELTFALESIGDRDDSAAVRGLVAPFLFHVDPVVREGAIYGITRHADESVRMILAMMSEYDPSACIRTVAREALEE